LELLKMGGFPAAAMAGKLWAACVAVPVLMWQVRENAWSKYPGDAQKTFDKRGSTDNERVWIEGTTRRFKDG
jgi:hypothetical protein